MSDNSLFSIDAGIISGSHRKNEFQEFQHSQRAAEGTVTYNEKPGITKETSHKDSLPTSIHLKDRRVMRVGRIFHHDHSICICSFLNYLFFVVETEFTSIINSVEHMQFAVH